MSSCVMNNPDVIDTDGRQLPAEFVIRKRYDQTSWAVVKLAGTAGSTVGTEADGAGRKMFIANPETGEAYELSTSTRVDSDGDVRREWVIGVTSETIGQLTVGDKFQIQLDGLMAVNSAAEGAANQNKGRQAAVTSTASQIDDVGGDAVVVSTNSINNMFFVDTPGTNAGDATVRVAIGDRATVN